MFQLYIPIPYNGFYFVMGEKTRQLVINDRPFPMCPVRKLPD